MNILVLNAGSSSVKYELFDLRSEASLASGTIERIGDAEGHAAAFQQIAEELSGKADDDSLFAVGHRVVHGGDVFREPTRIDDDVVERIRGLFPLAPLHNPPNVAGIEAGRQQFPNTPHVAVFDTAFHASMPEHTRRYAIPARIEHAHGVRRYGFHGTSYQFVTQRAASLLGKPAGETSLIAMHLGNGASACAIENGRSVDTTMGFTPLEGLVMGTRSGSIDPAAVLHLQREAGLSVDDVDRLLNKESGLAGICGDSDMRTILERMQAGEKSATIAVELFCHRIRQAIGAYLATLPPVDALVFTAGIGENQPAIRERVCRDLGRLGIELDDAQNRDSDAGDRFIDTGRCATRVLVIHTNEALEIARQCRAVLRN